MKISFATVAFALVATASADLSQFLSEIPECAKDCAVQAGTASPCITDLTVTCLCKNIDSLTAAIGSCLQTSNACDAASLSQLQSFGASVCPTTTAQTYPTYTSSQAAAATTVVTVTTCTSSSVSAAPSPASNGTVTVPSPPMATFTGGASNVGVMYGGVALMAALAWML